MKEQQSNELNKGMSEMNNMTKEEFEKDLDRWKNQRCGTVNEINNWVCTMKDTGEPLGNGPGCAGCPYF